MQSDAEALTLAHRDLAEIAAWKMHRRLRIAARKSAFTISYDELYGAALVALWKLALRYNPDHGATFKTFASASLAGRLIDYLRHEAGGDWRAKHQNPIRYYDFNRRGSFRDSVPWPAPQPIPDVDRLLARLPSVKARQVMTMYYLEEKTQFEISKCLQVTESRISQIIKESLQRLRNYDPRRTASPPTR